MVRNMQTGHIMQGANHAIARAMLVVSLTLALSGCLESAQRPAFFWRSDLSYGSMVETSPVIVVGQVISIGFVGERINATDDKGYKSTWQMVKVGATVENVLRGAVTGQTVDFYFYTSLGPISGDTNSLNVGDRCVFFLFSHDGILRAIRDFWRSSIEIGSGKHSTIPDHEDKMQARIATLLMKPGEDLVPKRFVRYMARSVSLAEELGGQCETIRLVQDLVRYPESEISRAAAAELEIRPQAVARCGGNGR